MPLQGKGFWIWSLRHCENGDPVAIAAKAKAAGLTHIFVKIADGSSQYNGDIGPLVTALRFADVQVWGWQYTYGDAPGPREEARFAASRVREFGLDGFVIDAEKEYKGHPDRATEYMNALRAELPELPIGFSSYYLPNYHRDFPWQEFLAGCDLDMPQVYWYSRDPVEALELSLAQHARFGKPIFPTGAAFWMTEDSATPDQIRRFLEAAQAKGLAGANFWSWQHATSEMWRAVTEFTWPVAVPTLQEMIEHHIQALNDGDLEEIAADYAENAMLITPQGVTRGREAIHGWFEELLTDTLPGAQFAMATLIVEGEIAFLEWTAESHLSTVCDGVDTFVIREDQIQVQTSRFTLSPPE